MALIPVTLVETIRPWHTAGLNHLLCDSSALLSEELEQLVSQPSGKTNTAPPPPIHSPTAPKPLGPAYLAQQAPALRVAPSPPIPIQNPSQAPVQVDQADWPLPWQQAFAKAAKRASLLWTYWELGLDLCGQGNQTRSQTLRAILGTLKLPKGSSTFWPCALPTNGDHDSLKGDLPVFISGVIQLQPKAVIIFGSATVTQLCLPLSQQLPYTQEVRQGRLHVLLPSLDDLQHPNAINKTSTYLRSCLQIFPALLPA